MFGIGGWEFILIAVLALLLFGPDKLPQFARTLGRFMHDIKKYQTLIESTVRGEILAADPSLQKKDQFETGKAFRERVAGGGFAKPAPKSETAPEGSEDAEPAESGEAAESPVEPAVFVEEGEPISAMAGEIADDEPGEVALPTDEGEGERDQA